MSSPELYLSFNEILFYFTRAATGGGVPFGPAEDFGHAAIWIAASGLDPALVTSNALKELDCGNSSLKTKITEGKEEIVLTAESGKKLSAIQAGIAVCDLISTHPEIPKNRQSIIAEKVDYPLIVCAALGAADFVGCEISWPDTDASLSSILICEEGSWRSSWNVTIVPEFVDGVDVKVIFVNKHEGYHGKWEGSKFYSGKIKKKLLETGVPVYDSWSVIYSFFKRCLVPSTAESRSIGAGAGLVDSD